MRAVLLIQFRGAKCSIASSRSHASALEVSKARHRRDAPADQLQPRATNVAQAPVSLSYSLIMLDILKGTYRFTPTNSDD